MLKQLHSLLAVQNDSTAVIRNANGQAATNIYAHNRVSLHKKCAVSALI